ncbi:flagellar biosynthetic protein FliO [Rummeliibacillus pycnus]|uniref:flagellar biosynthetic protein FliO n=1 Tax=Rummeliibacillus pycnus TaxID=101070 RepID=UPI0037C9DD8B
MLYRTLLKLMLCVSLFTVVTIQPIQQSIVVYAESNSSAYDCIKNPDACKDDSPSPVESKDQSTGVGLSAGDYIRMVLALIFVIALLYGVLKFVNRRNNKYQQNQLMQNLGGISLGQQKSVQLLKVGNSLYLVGVGDDVHILKEVKDNTEKEHLLSLYNDKQELSAQVPYVSELFSKFKSRHSEKEGDSSDEEFKEEFQKRLSEIQQNRRKELEEWKQKERENE